MLAITNEINRKRILPLFILFIALVGFLNAFRFGAASLDYYTVRNYLELWTSEGGAQTQENYNTAKSAINTATILHHSHPHYIELSAQITEWGHVSGFEPDMSLQQAENTYLAATKIRPLWPVTWANLAMLKWRKQEFDDEMLKYLNNADKLGPQKAEVHLLFAQLGLSLYQANQPFYTRIKESVQSRIFKGLRASQVSTKLVSFIKQSGHKKTVCRWLNIDLNNTDFEQKKLGC